MSCVTISMVFVSAGELRVVFIHVVRCMWCKDIIESLRAVVVRGLRSVGVSAGMSDWIIVECGCDCDSDCDFEGTGNKQTTTFLNAVSDAMARSRV